MSLTGRCALVTGASRGIGHAVAQRLVASGADVVMVARGAEVLTAAAEALGPHAHPLAGDISDPATVYALADTMAAQGLQPDILINNAGLFSLAPLATMAPADFTEMIQVNLVGPFLLLRSLVPGMTARGAGHVVSIGSVADRAVFPGNGAYAASKYGQRAMHEALRQELRGTGVRCTLISPAATDTPIWDPIDPDHQPGFPTRASMLRPEDVAEAVHWAVLQPAHVTIDELRLSSS
ncbi:MAG: SDR family oxidoreductase [Gemmatimonadaceae bacterium]